MEAGFVAHTAGRMGLPFVSEAGDVGGYAEENKLSLEEAARKLRYRFLFAQARAAQAGAVAVGHTADDQVETILMHFLRGAGLAGLKGMAGRTLLNEFDRDIPLVRPILHLWRNETEAYCREHGLEPVEDPTNRDETYFRNRLRHSLIPELEKYNQGFKNTLLRTAEALAGDYEAVENAVDQAWEKAVLKAERDSVTFRGGELGALPQGLRRNLLRRAMTALRPAMRTLDFNTLKRAADFSAPATELPDGKQAPRQVDLTEGLVLFREGGTICMAALEADLPNAHWPTINGALEAPLELPINGQVRLNQNFILSAQEVEGGIARALCRENTDPFTAWLDLDLTGDRLSVRDAWKGTPSPRWG